MALNLTSKAALADDNSIQEPLLYLYGTKVCEESPNVYIEIRSTKLFGHSSLKRTERPTSWPERDVIA